MRADLDKKGDQQVHPLPGSSATCPSDLDARLVVLGVEPHIAGSRQRCRAATKAILETRGGTPRLPTATPSCSAADKTRLQDPGRGVRTYLAWTSILSEKELLDLSPYQVRQAETRSRRRQHRTRTVPETYQWLLAPMQTSPQAAVAWQAMRLAGQETLAARASKKLRTDELLVTSFGATRLRMEMDRVPLWRGDHVAITQLVDDFGRYLYLPRLKEAVVLLDAVRDAGALLTWEQDAFAYAESYDEAAHRYRGLRWGQHMAISDGDTGLLVRPEVARRQIDAEITPPQPGDGKPGTSIRTGRHRRLSVARACLPRPRRFHGTVTLDPARAGRDASKITDEVLTHLVGLIGSSVRVTLEIDAEIPAGVPDHVVRTVTENSRTLKFTSHGFERE